MPKIKKYMVNEVYIHLISLVVGIATIAALIQKIDLPLNELMSFDNIAPTENAKQEIPILNLVLCIIVGVGGVSYCLAGIYNAIKAAVHSKKH